MRHQPHHFAVLPNAIRRPATAAAALLFVALARRVAGPCARTACVVGVALSFHSRTVVLNASPARTCARTPWNGPPATLRGRTKYGACRYSAGAASKGSLAFAGSFASAGSSTRHSRASGTSACGWWRWTLGRASRTYGGRRIGGST